MSRRILFNICAAASLFAGSFWGFISCGTQPTESMPSDFDFTTSVTGTPGGVMLTRGHEEVTRFAMEIVNSQAASRGSSLLFDQTGQWDHVSFSSSDSMKLVVPIHYGNFATDIPLSLTYETHSLNLPRDPSWWPFKPVLTPRRYANILNNVYGHDMLILYGYCGKGYMNDLGADSGLKFPVYSLTRLGSECQDNMDRDGSTLNFMKVDKGPLAPYAHKTTNPKLEPELSNELEVISSTMAWQDAGSTQSIHFLRNFYDINRNPRTKVEITRSDMSTYTQACQAGRDHIRNAALYALSYYFRPTNDQQYKNRFQLAQFWVGHGLHSIQDSFSVEHALRSADMKTIEDICSYGKEVENVCMHKGIHADPNETGMLSGDRIWTNNEGCIQATSLPTMTKRMAKREYDSMRSFRCLKKEARFAVYASAGYMNLVSDLIAQAEKHTALGRSKNRTRQGLAAFYRDVADPAIEMYLSSGRSKSFIKDPSETLKVSTILVSANDTAAPAGAAKMRTHDLLENSSAEERYAIAKELTSYDGHGLFNCTAKDENAKLGTKEPLGVNAQQWHFDNLLTRFLDITSFDGK